jgi:uncharacterized protein (DUF4415 family)
MTKSFALSQLEEQSERNANCMTKIVKRTLSASRLTAARKQRLKQLSRRLDSEVDTSDIPELTEQFWQNAVRNPFYRPVKQQLTLRLDADRVLWLTPAIRVITALFQHGAQAEASGFPAWTR